MQHQGLSSIQYVKAALCYFVGLNSNLLNRRFDDAIKEEFGGFSLPDAWETCALQVYPRVVGKLIQEQPREWDDCLFRALMDSFEARHMRDNNV